MKAYNRVCARIDLDAVEYNIEMMRRNVREGVKMLGVVKTDGYGHGAVQIAKMLSPKDYMWGFAVATLDEALVLRRAGIEKPLLVLGCIFPDQREDMIKHDIRMTLYTEEMAREVSELAVKMGKQAYIHIKLDTGMSRLGFMIEEETVEIIERISRMPNLALEGMYTHFAKADEIDKSFTEKQIKNYVWMKETLEQRGVTFQYYHCSNSAGIIDVPEANMDLVRAGISTYGLYPSEEVHKDNVPLKPAMELISHVAHVKWVEAGTPVSYGGTYITDRKTKIATIPVGYGDGYPRSLSNKGYVLIHGKKAPILGRVCMDQFMVDATEIDDVKYADKVTLVGNDGDEKLPVEVLSGLSGRFNYEFVCDLGKRIPREFIRHGDIVEQMDYFA
ncbi:alanine racemase [Extibacter muris]|uniref:alanine racemase n=1 Tax=Extibacter muris TaxID=1796622 RepID=UPI001D06778F|nr:alanine racemase [Extibacter muris]MCB6200244.1 alanine racemase [Extibacter muris]MCQ4663097.1 alanine racemase [Extibacter muris]MCQ4692234.1 alanine racemase [Extibacter muris]